MWGGLINDLRGLILTNSSEVVYDKVYMESIINNSIPLMILTTTSIEGVSVACLDVVEKV